MLSNENSRLVRFLRWTEKYTKTDMVYLAHGSFWLSSSSLITSGVSFGLALAFANLLTKDAYGTYKYVLTLFGMLCIACLRGMDTVVTQGAARHKDHTVIVGLWAKMRWSLIGSLGALAIAGYYFYGRNNAVAESLLVAAIFIPLMEPFGIFNAVLVGKKNFKLSSLLGSGGQIAAGLALILALVLFHHPIVVFATYCMVWTLTRFMSLRYTLHKYPPTGESEHHALSYALHSSIAGAAAVVISSLDSILVYHYLGAAELALYSFAMAPVSQAKAILNTPTFLAIPKLAGRSSAEIQHILLKRTGALVLAGIAITAIYAVLVYPFFKIFFRQYIDAVPYSLAFSLTLTMQVANAFVSSAVESRVTLIPRRLIYLWNIPGIIIALCAIFLIPLIGLWGAIIGQILSTAMSTAITWVMWRIIRHKQHAS